MRLGHGLLLLALATLTGCDASTPKEWQKSAKADPATPKPTATTTAATNAAATNAATATAKAPTPPPTALKPVPGEDWGGAAITWLSPTDGLAEAKRTGKPAMLVLYTGWCPHCKNYQKLFTDPRLAEAAKSFVMIRANSDEAEDFAGKYAPDGGYIPRTMFLKPDGAILTDVRAHETGEFQYFFDERDAAPLLAAMDKAKQKLVR